MGASSPVAAIGASHCGEFIPPEMFTPGTTMPAAAENADLVNKVALFQSCSFTVPAQKGTTIANIL